MLPPPKNSCRRFKPSSPVSTSKNTPPLPAWLLPSFTLAIAALGLRYLLHIFRNHSPREDLEENLHGAEGTPSLASTPSPWYSRTPSLPATPPPPQPFAGEGYSELEKGCLDPDAWFLTPMSLFADVGEPPRCQLPNGMGRWDRVESVGGFRRHTVVIR